MNLAREGLLVLQRKVVVTLHIKRLFRLGKLSVYIAQVCYVLSSRLSHSYMFRHYYSPSLFFFTRPQQEDGRQIFE